MSDVPETPPDDCLFVTFQWAETKWYLECPHCGFSMEEDSRFDSMEKRYSCKKAFRVQE